MWSFRPCDSKSGSGWTRSGRQNRQNGTMVHREVNNTSNYHSDDLNGLTPIYFCCSMVGIRNPTCWLTNSDRWWLTIDDRWCWLTKHLIDNRWSMPWLTIDDRWSMPWLTIDNRWSMPWLMIDNRWSMRWLMIDDRWSTSWLMIDDRWSMVVWRLIDNRQSMIEVSKLIDDHVLGFLM